MHPDPARLDRATTLTRSMCHLVNVTVKGEWERLLHHLNAWATARETPTGIEVTFEQLTGGLRTVELVVTPDDWSGYWGVIPGDEGSAAAYLRDLLTTGVPLDKAFVVYDREEWDPSDTRDPPPDPDEGFQPEPGGQWVVTDCEGIVTSRYADWIDRQ
jgi:hypothetical protein